MGMDVYGKCPQSELGEYFRNNVWWWHPLWDYCYKVASDLISQGVYESGHSNDGSGLNALKSRKLAERLEAEILAGRTLQYQKDYREEVEALPDETCEVCAGTGRRLPPPQVGPGDQSCNSCKGKGTTRPIATWYSFSVENVKEFVEFLKDCGGFEIH